MPASISDISPCIGPQPATFSYFKFIPSIHTHEKPYEILVNLPSATKNRLDYRRSNQEFESHETVVEDIRGKEDEFSLNIQGVCWRNWRGPDYLQDVDGEELKKKGHESLREGYIHEAEDFIRDELEKEDGRRADIVKIFDYKLRQSMDENEFIKRKVNLEDGLDPMIPVTHPHIDQSFQGAIQRVHVHMKEEALQLLERRFRIVNLWKPLKPVKSWPLAICDTRTVSFEDLVPSDLVRRKFVGETFYSRYNAAHRWYYLSQQQTNEVTMLKIYDSDPDAKAKFCLHSAFQLAGVGVEETRESFEVRAMVFDSLE